MAKTDTGQLTALRETAEYIRNNEQYVRALKEIESLESQLTRLRDWKESAMTLLARYDSIAETFRGKPGSSKVDNLKRGVQELRETAGNALAYFEDTGESCRTSDLVAALREALAHAEQEGSREQRV